MTKSIPVKVVLVGQSAVGKTCIAARYVNGYFQHSAVSTVGASYLTKTITIDKQLYDFNIWDTAGQELYRSLTPMYYRNAHAAFVVFDVTNKSTFLASENWIKDLQEGNDNVLIMLVGNKIDLQEQRVVQFAEAETLAKKYNLQYIETSALSGVGIDKAFQMVIVHLKSDDYLKKKLNPEPNVLTPQKENVENEKKSCC